MSIRKKILVMSMIGIVLAIFIINTNTYAWCNTITARKEINAVRLTLANGTVMHNIQFAKQLNVVPESSTRLRNIYINFIVDTSPSMQSYLESVKQSMKTFLDEVYNFYSSSNLAYEIRTSFIGFNENTNPSEEETVGNIPLINRTRNGAKAEVDKFQINSGNRDIEQATNIALNNINFNDYSNYVLPVTVLFTDRLIENTTEEMLSSANNNLDNLSKNKMSLIFAALIGNSTEENSTIERALLDNVYGLIATAVPTNNIDAWIYGWDQSPIGTVPAISKIRESLVDYSTIVPAVTSTTANSFMATGSDIVLFMDDEILHGALLEIEYSIICGSSAHQIADKEKNDNLHFSRDTKLLTEPSRTNASYGWNFGNYKGKNIITNNRIIKCKISIDYNINTKYHT